MILKRQNYMRTCSQNFHNYYMQKGVFGNKPGKKSSFVVMARKSELVKQRKVYVESLNQPEDDFDKRYMKRMRLSVSKGLVDSENEQHNDEEN